MIDPFAPKTPRPGDSTRLAWRAPTTLRFGLRNPPHFCGGARQAVTYRVHCSGARPAERRPERDGVASHAGRSTPGRPLIGRESPQSWAGLKSGLRPLPLKRSRGRWLNWRLSSLLSLSARRLERWDSAFPLSVPPLFFC